MGAPLAGTWRHPRGLEATPRCMGSIVFEKKRTPRCMGALLPLKNAQVHPRDKNVDFSIKHVDFSLGKCRFEAHRGVLHYVLRRTVVILTKNVDF